MPPTDRKNVRAALYLRVSTVEQCEGVSMDVQEDRCRTWAKARGAEVVKVYRDDGLSGKDTARPAYQSMLADLKAGKFDVLVALKIDRLNRDMHDFLELGEIADAHNVDLVFPSQNVDTSTPVGRLMRNMLALFAQFERELIAERVRESMRSAAASGRHVGGRTPFGYRIKPEGGMEPNPATRAALVELFARYIAGENCHDLVRWLRSTGHSLSHSAVIRTLRNPAYIGKQTWAGQVHAGTHEPLLDETTWIAAQERLAANSGASKGPRRTAKAHYDYLLDGLLYCGLCGAHLTTHAAHGKSGKRYFYYRCAGTLKARTCTLPPHGAEEVDRYVIDELVKAGVDEGFIERAMAGQKDRATVDMERLRKQEHRAQSEATGAAGRIRNLMELAANGEWGPDDAKELKAELRAKRLARDAAEARLAQIRTEMRACERTMTISANAGEAFREFLQNLRTTEGPMRRAIIRAMVRRGVLSPGRIDIDLVFDQKQSGEHPSECSPESASGGPNATGGELVRLSFAFTTRRGRSVQMLSERLCRADGTVRTSSPSSLLPAAYPVATGSE